MGTAWKDYYALLGVTPDAGSDAIERAYRVLKEKWSSESSVSGVQRHLSDIEEAYQVLSDPERRRRYDEMRQSATIRLTPDPLPEGALLRGRRYEVMAFLRTRKGVNEYRAIETMPRKRCPHCQILNAFDSDFCEHCGSDLGDAEAVTLSVLLQEAQTFAPFGKERTLHEKGIRHPVLITPLDAFEDNPYDERVYIVLPERAGTPLKRVEPEDVTTTFAWGHLIADALAYLDRNGLGLSVSLHDAVLFTDEGDPFILIEAISLEPMDTKTLREGFMTILKGWLQILNAQGWIEEVRRVIEMAPDWDTIARHLRGLVEEAEAPPLIRLTLSAQTDVGRIREHNEDSYLTMHFERCHLDRVETLSILAVADGMGGHAAGEVASRLCLETFSGRVMEGVQRWLRGEEIDWREVLRVAVKEANRKVFTEAQALNNDMGTTLVAAVVVGDTVTFVNVGDSRGYLVRDGQLQQITKDHSYVQQLVDSGMLTPEQARWHPQRNIITRAIGLESMVEMDFFEERVRPGDLILLCSDGLNDMLTDEEMEKLLLTAPSPKEAVEALIQKANEAGGEDNITVVLARVGR